MFIFKIIFAVGSVFSQPEVDSDGWYSVPRPKKEVLAQGSDERDSSVWVVFSKKLGKEKLLVSLPKEPTYRYMDGEGKELEVFSSNDEAEFRFQVIDKVYDRADFLLEARKQGNPGAIIVSEVHGDKSAPYAEITYWKEGSWYCERFVITSERTYFFQTKSTDLPNEAHQKFVNSFSTSIK